MKKLSYEVFKLRPEGKDETNAILGSTNSFKSKLDL